MNLENLFLKKWFVLLLQQPLEDTLRLKLFIYEWLKKREMWMTSLTTIKNLIAIRAHRFPFSIDLHFYLYRCNYAYQSIHKLYSIVIHQNKYLSFLVTVFKEWNLYRNDRNWVNYKKHHHHFCHLLTWPFYFDAKDSCTLNTLTVTLFMRIFMEAINFTIEDSFLHE